MQWFSEHWEGIYRLVRDHRAAAPSRVPVRRDAIAAQALEQRAADAPLPGPSPADPPVLAVELGNKVRLVPLSSVAPTPVAAKTKAEVRQREPASARSENGQPLPESFRQFST